MRQRLWGAQGVTLVEMTVTVTLLSAVIALVAGGMVTATHLLGQNRLRLDEIAENRLAMEAMTKTIRTAVEPRLLGSNSDAAAFIQGDKRSVIFYAALSSMVEPAGSGANRFGPAKVTYSVTGGNLVETYQLPDLHAATDHDYKYCAAGSTGCQVRSRTLAQHVTGGSVFTYYGESGAELQVPLSPDSLEAVDSIDIVLTSQTGTDEVSTVVSRVSLVNGGNAPKPDDGED